MPFGPLVDPSFVREHRAELTLVDCRFVLGEPSAGERAYVAGHVPGAAAERGVAEDGETIAYCGSGVTASVLVLAATVAGIRPPRLYAGSWSEWSRRGLPVERG